MRKSEHHIFSFYSYTNLPNFDIIDSYACFFEFGYLIKRNFDRFTIFGNNVE